MKEIVFVYGTLKRGYGNNRLLESSKFLGEYILSSEYKFKLINLGSFPALIPSKVGFNIKGELYLVNRETRNRLDRLEGHPHFYKRTYLNLVILNYSYKMIFTYVIKNEYEDNMIIQPCENNTQEWN